MKSIQLSHTCSTATSQSCQEEEDPSSDFIFTSPDEDTDMEVLDQDISPACCHQEDPKEENLCEESDKDDCATEKDLKHDDSGDESDNEDERTEEKKINRMWKLSPSKRKRKHSFNFSAAPSLKRYRRLEESSSELTFNPNEDIDLEVLDEDISPLCCLQEDPKDEELSEESDKDECDAEELRDNDGSDESEEEDEEDDESDSDSDYDTESSSGDSSSDEEGDEKTPKDPNPGRRCTYCGTVSTHQTRKQRRKLMKVWVCFLSEGRVATRADRCYTPSQRSYQVCRYFMGRPICYHCRFIMPSSSLAAAMLPSSLTASTSASSFTAATPPCSTPTATFPSSLADSMPPSSSTASAPPYFLAASMPPSPAAAAMPPSTVAAPMPPFRFSAAKSSSPVTAAMPLSSVTAAMPSSPPPHNQKQRPYKRRKYGGSLRVLLLDESYDDAVKRAKDEERQAEKEPDNQPDTNTPSEGPEQPQQPSYAGDQPASPGMPDDLYSEETVELELQDEELSLWEEEVFNVYSH